jgi:hypothetical protein
VTEVVEDDGSGRLVMNFGPQHPATHGTLRSIFTLEGETIVKADVEIGYLHTGFEKLGENMTYQQWVTVSDRMNYLSAINNNVVRTEMGNKLVQDRLDGRRRDHQPDDSQIVLEGLNQRLQVCCPLRAVCHHFGYKSIINIKHNATVAPKR